MAELTPKTIAVADLAVADERGAKGFTMRTVAERLDVTPMALYHHVEDKAGLVALLVDEVIGERPLPPPTGAWREDILELARFTREITLAHPAVARLRNAYQVWTPSIFPMTERWLSLWQQSGLELGPAMLAASASSTAIIGFIGQELILVETTPPDDTMLSPFPNARLAFGATRDGAREFDLVVRSLLEGLLSSLGSGGTEPGPQGADSASRRTGRILPQPRARRTPPKPRSRR
jgi:AcrR family transcriptional regulator